MANPRHSQPAASQEASKPASAPETQAPASEAPAASESPSSAPQGQTFGEIKNDVENSLLRGGASPAEARHEVSRLALAMRKHCQMEEMLVELVEVQDTVTLVAFLGGFIELVKESNLFVTDKPSVVSKLETALTKMQEAVARVEAKRSR